MTCTHTFVQSTTFTGVVVPAPGTACIFCELAQLREELSALEATEKELTRVLRLADSLSDERDALQRALDKHEEASRSVAGEVAMARDVEHYVGMHAAQMPDTLHLFASALMRLDAPNWVEDIGAEVPKDNLHGDGDQPLPESYDEIKRREDVDQ